MKLTDQELGEIRVMHDIIKREQWKLDLVKVNTAFVPNGQKWTKQQKAILNLLTNEKENFISQCCRAKGVKGKISIDLGTGEITEKKDE